MKDAYTRINTNTEDGGVSVLLETDGLNSNVNINSVAELQEGETPLATSRVLVFGDETKDSKKEFVLTDPNFNYYDEIAKHSLGYDDGEEKFEHLSRKGYRPRIDLQNVEYGKAQASIKFDDRTSNKIAAIIGFDEDGIFLSPLNENYTNTSGALYGASSTNMDYVVAKADRLRPNNKTGCWSVFTAIQAQGGAGYKFQGGSSGSFGIINITVPFEYRKTHSAEMLAYLTIADEVVILNFLSPNAKDVQRPNENLAGYGFARGNYMHHDGYYIYGNDSLPSNKAKHFELQVPRFYYMLLVRSKHGADIGAESLGGMSYDYAVGENQPSVTFRNYNQEGEYTSSVAHNGGANGGSAILASDGGGGGAASMFADGGAGATAYTLHIAGVPNAEDAKGYGAGGGGGSTNMWGTFGHIGYGGDGFISIVYDDEDTKEVNYYLSETDYSNSTKYYTQNITEKHSPIAPTEPAVAGKSFSGWCKQGTETVVDLGKQSITKKTNYVAKFEDAIYTARFVVDGETYDTQTGTYNTKLTAPTTPTKVDYTFTYWSINNIQIKDITEIDIQDVQGLDIVANFEYTANRETIQIDGLDIEFEMNMTWQDYINSRFNTNDLQIVDGYILDSTGTQVLATGWTQYSGGSNLVADDNTITRKVPDDIVPEEPSDVEYYFDAGVIPSSYIDPYQMYHFFDNDPSTYYLPTRISLKIEDKDFYAEKDTLWRYWAMSEYCLQSFTYFSESKYIAETRDIDSGLYKYVVCDSNNQPIDGTTYISSGIYHLENIQGEMVSIVDWKGYKPSTDLGSSMNNFRYCFATKFNGDYYLLGSDFSTSDGWKINEKTKSVERITYGGAITGGSNGYSMTGGRIGNKFIAIGSPLKNSDLSCSVDTYDLETGECVTSKVVANANYYSRSVVACNGKLYLFGGFSGTNINDYYTSHYLSAISIFNPETNTYSSGGYLPRNLVACQGVAVGDYIYIFGGYSKTSNGNSDSSYATNYKIYKYNTNTKTCSTLSSEITALSGYDGYALRAVPCVVGTYIYLFCEMSRTRVPIYMLDTSNDSLTCLNIYKKGSEGGAACYAGKNRECFVIAGYISNNSNEIIQYFTHKVPGDPQELYFNTTNTFYKFTNNQTFEQWVASTNNVDNFKLDGNYIKLGDEYLTNNGVRVVKTSLIDANTTYGFYKPNPYDLTNTVWKFKSSYNIPSDIPKTEFNLKPIINGEQYETLHINYSDTNGNFFYSLGITKTNKIIVYIRTTDYYYTNYGLTDGEGWYSLVNESNVVTATKLSSPPTIKITDGTAVKNVDAIEWLLENTTRTFDDLTGTKWVFKNTLVYDSSFGNYSVDYVFGEKGNIGSSLYMDSADIQTSGGSTRSVPSDKIYSLCGSGLSSGTTIGSTLISPALLYSDADSMTINNVAENLTTGNSLENSIVFLGGTDATNSTLIDWLLENATFVASPDIISFTVRNTTYYAEKGMTWTNFAGSLYNYDNGIKSTGASSVETTDPQATNTNLYLEYTGNRTYYTLAKGNTKVLNNRHYDYDIDWENL